MINIVICDDESGFQEILKHKIMHCMMNAFDMPCTITVKDSLDAFKCHLENHKVDIAFLDIMVNDENAMDWSLENINTNYTQIIFMTSYPQCAYNISETNCCYFLIKPKMTDDTLTKALRRALNKTAKKDPNLTIVKSGGKNYTINFQDIIYIETFNNNLVLHIHNGDDITIYSSLKDYAEKLPPNFLQSHKCYMINMNHVAGYEPYKFVMMNKKELPIPPKKYRSVINSYRNYIKNI